MTQELRYDEIGNWSEIKLEIIRKYAAAYCRIVRNNRLLPIYIDAFAGAGKHISKATRDFVPGSPEIAIGVEPPFEEYHLIDLDQTRVNALNSLKERREGVFVYPGDCNRILREKVFPRAEYKDFRRALCILDPYGLDLEWDVIAHAGKMGTVDIFLNFPVADINRNVLWTNPGRVSDRQAKRLTRFWGDTSWRDVAYVPSSQGDLFLAETEEKVDNSVIAEAFRRRLREVAGFGSVPRPMAMRNSVNAIVYYLYFASPKPIPGHIVADIFSKYER